MGERVTECVWVVGWPFWGPRGVYVSRIPHLYQRLDCWESDLRSQRPGSDAFPLDGPCTGLVSSCVDGGLDHSKTPSFVFLSLSLSHSVLRSFFLTISSLSHLLLRYHCLHLRERKKLGPIRSELRPSLLGPQDPKEERRKRGEKSKAVEKAKKSPKKGDTETGTAKKKKRNRESERVWVRERETHSLSLSNDSLHLTFNRLAAG